MVYLLLLQVRTEQGNQIIMKSDIQIKTFRNENLSGYGYDIILNGHVYVHQPNIPALPGNNGFATEKQAQKVAELVAYKISHNIFHQH